MAISEALIDFGEDDNIGEEVLDDGKSDPYRGNAPVNRIY